MPWVGLQYVIVDFPIILTSFLVHVSLLFYLQYKTKYFLAYYGQQSKRVERGDDDFSTIGGKHVHTHGAHSVSVLKQIRQFKVDATP